MTFDLELRPEVSHECGMLQIAARCYSFELELGHWRRWDYVDDWYAALQELVQGARVVALMTATLAPGEPGERRAFVLSRRADDIAILRCEFSQTDPVALNAAGRIVGGLLDTRGAEVGVTSIDDIVRYLARRMP